MDSEEEATPERPSSRTMGLSRKRASLIKSFLRQGEQNHTFANKAPSILPAGDSAEAPPPGGLLPNDNKNTAANAAANANVDAAATAGGAATAPSADAASGNGSAGESANTAQQAQQQAQDEAAARHGLLNNSVSTVDWSRARDRELENIVSSEERIARKNWCLKTVMTWYYRAQGWILAFLIGVIVAFVASIINISVNWLTDIRLGYCKTHYWLDYSICCTAGAYVQNIVNDHCEAWVPWTEAIGGSFASNMSNYGGGFLIYVISSVTLAFLCVWMIVRVTRFAAGSGIPEIKTILAGAQIRAFLGMRVLIVKSTTLILAVGSGLAVGKEGPFVHLAVCVGNVACRLFRKFEDNPLKRNEMRSAAAAVGVSFDLCSSFFNIISPCLRTNSWPSLSELPSEESSSAWRKSLMSSPTKPCIVPFSAPLWQLRFCSLLTRCKAANSSCSTCHTRPRGTGSSLCPLFSSAALVA